MKKTSYFVLFGILICFFTSFAVCNDKFCKPPDKIDLENIQPRSRQVKADIFYDASFSMVGFVSNINSYYIRTLQLVESSFISGWPDQTIGFYKFGTIVRKIPREEALGSTQAGFYTDEEFKDKTHIEKVVKEAKVDHLTIIITDLFENNADVNLLIMELNKKFLSEKSSVGILGVKSEFNGKVWDVGIPGLNFEYKTDKLNQDKLKKDKQKQNKSNPDKSKPDKLKPNKLNPERYRPFYILMLGKYADIQHFYKNINANGLNKFPKKKFIILSPFVVRRLGAFGDLVSDRTKSQKLIEVTSLIEPVKRYNNIKQFIVKSEGAFFESKIKVRFVDSLSFNPENLETETKVLKWYPRQKFFKECPQAKKTLCLKNLSIKRSELGFRADIIYKNFPGKGIYSYECLIRPGHDSFTLPDWISDWDMDVDKLNDWIANPQQFNGATTLNLKFFVNTIWRIIAQKYRPKIAKLYFYIKK